MCCIYTTNGLCVAIIVYEHIYILYQGPSGIDYDPLTYRAVKDHPLGLRSVYNEDLPLSLVKPAMKDIYTTWKARKVIDKNDYTPIHLLYEY